MDQPPGAGPPASPGGGGPDWGEMKGKLAAAKGPERLILIGGVLFFIDSFLPWYGVSGSIAGIDFSSNTNGWGSQWMAVIAILLGLAATILVAASTFGIQLPVQATGQLLLALCAGAFFFVLLRLITETSFTKFGLYLAIVFTAVMAYGAWQRYKAAQ
jgi:hypothetical protein